MADKEVEAGGGLLHRRSLRIGGRLSAASLKAGVPAATLQSPPWMLHPGAPLSGYGVRCQSKCTGR